MKSEADYEAEGYQAQTWYLASCPYTKPHIREAWQRGAWRWQKEQRATPDTPVIAKPRVTRTP